MAHHLIDAGHSVTVWNRTPAATDALVSAGAQRGDTPGAVAAASPIVACCLPNGSVVEDVLLRDDGVFAGWREGGHPAGILIDHSTIDPADAERLAERCASEGHAFVDAPVSGGPAGAQSGTLAVMLGGEAHAVATATPIIESYAATIVHLGGPGTGQVAKLANQICIAATVLGLGEAFRLTDAYGLDPQLVAEVLAGATASSMMLQTRAPVPGLQPAMPASNEWAPGFAADFMAKDLDFALRAAASHGTPIAATAMVRELLARVQAAGSGDRDWTIFTTLLGDAGD
jgi:3-hydroxyisobutyrate dehydrogenase-like beta-hydroxyacid dehydrogenase